MTISSKIEGWRLEMWIRLDDRISMNDLADRMPCKPGMVRPMVCNGLHEPASHADLASVLLPWATSVHASASLMVWHLGSQGMGPLGTR